MKIDIKNSRGAVTLYVLMTLAVLTILLSVLYVTISNKQLSNLEVTKQIKSTYENDVNKVNEIYENLIKY